MTKRCLLSFVLPALFRRPFPASYEKKHVNHHPIGQLLAIETDVKQAVRILEERIARRESAEAALRQWRRQLPPKVRDFDVCFAVQERSCSVPVEYVVPVPGIVPYMFSAGTR